MKWKTNGEFTFYFIINHQVHSYICYWFFGIGKIYFWCLETHCVNLGGFNCPTQKWFNIVYLDEESPPPQKKIVVSYNHFFIGKTLFFSLFGSWEPHLRWDHKSHNICWVFWWGLAPLKVLEPYHHYPHRADLIFWLIL